MTETLDPPPYQRDEDVLERGRDRARAPDPEALPPQARHQSRRVDLRVGQDVQERPVQGYLAHARQLVDWANANHIGLVAFWSAGRDNGSCPGGGVSPTCSSIAQGDLEFTSIFHGFKG